MGSFFYFYKRKLLNLTIKIAASNASALDFYDQDTSGANRVYSTQNPFTNTANYPKKNSGGAMAVLADDGLNDTPDQTISNLNTTTNTVKD